MSKKKKRPEIGESWLLPYSDMLTLLLALFIILFAVSEVDSQKYEKLAEVFRSEFKSGGAGILDEESKPQEGQTPEDQSSKKTNTFTDDEPKDEKNQNDVAQQDLQQIKESIDSYVTKNELAGKFHTELTGEGLMITILDNVFFDKGSAEVKKDAQSTAREVAKLLYSDPPHEVVVNGHTDDTPISNSSYASNWELSVARAVNFMTVILGQGNLDPTLFSAKGYGEYKPAVPNTNIENRQKNRRVEILVLPNEG
ncbi:flagellar motor protein MotB [Bacilli bacterium]|uniref:flagellar motor protein MotB n=1 Tax=Oceanobacillus TaxID=182709 RepID=UPI0006211A10|nr:flagellar motor protein MotB [Bacilli bacterium VT-13-104]PZD84854.1 flagellar motor protein MotB [Bacilli bacterium]PZD86375.1 flagellar motor protein MotB [Bacilli bacterium]PZD89835.1 flagellar motor protein MotB [Bacilli bacterium]RCO05345.1 flagellar motor protein MotB [Bacilli bacterium]